MATPYNLVIDQGSTFRRTFQWVGHSLSGWTVRAQIRRKQSRVGGILATLEMDTHLTVQTNPDGDIISLVIDGDVSGGWNFKEGWWDLLAWQEPPGTEEARLLEGRVTLRPQVTVKA